MLLDIKKVRDGLRIRGANHPHVGVYINRNDVYYRSFINKGNLV